MRSLTTKSMLYFGAVIISLNLMGCNRSKEQPNSNSTAKDGNNNSKIAKDGSNSHQVDKGPPEPPFDDDPQKHFQWFANRYLAELPQIHSSPFQDDNSQRQERVHYIPLAHQIEFKLSDSTDKPHAATLIMKIKSEEDPNDDKANNYTTDCKIRFVARDGKWEMADGQMYDPSFESWSPISDISWEAPLFEAARKVYEIKGGGF